MRMPTEARATLTGEIERKFKELEQFCKEHYAIESNADLIRFFIAQVHKQLIKTEQ
jgi:hypothetical protein